MVVKEVRLQRVRNLAMAAHSYGCHALLAMGVGPMPCGIGRRWLLSGCTLSKLPCGSNGNHSTGVNSASPWGRHINQWLMLNNNQRAIDLPNMWVCEPSHRDGDPMAVQVSLSHERCNLRRAHEKELMTHVGVGGEAQSPPGLLSVHAYCDTPLTFV